VLSSLEFGISKILMKKTFLNKLYFLFLNTLVNVYVVGLNNKLKNTNNF
jgi:hypothetical protein